LIIIKIFVKKARYSAVLDIEKSTLKVSTSLESTDLNIIQKGVDVNQRTKKFKHFDLIRENFEARAKAPKKSWKLPLYCTLSSRKI